MEKRHGYSHVIQVFQAEIDTHATGDVGSYSCFSVEIPLPSSINQFCLDSLSLTLQRLRNWHDEFGTAAALDNPLRRLALIVELPISDRVLIGRVENGPFEGVIIHFLVAA
jgi:hypothetical protein